MAVFLVDISLRSPTHDYTALWSLMSKIKAQRAIDTTWLIDVTNPITEVTNLLLQHLEAKDQLLVMELAVGAAWSVTRVDDETRAWLKTRRP